MTEIKKEPILIAKYDDYKEQTPPTYTISTIEGAVDNICLARKLPGDGAGIFPGWLNKEEIKSVLDLNTSVINKYFKKVKIYDNKIVSEKEVRPVVNKYRKSKEDVKAEVDIIKLVYNGDKGQILDALKLYKKDLAENQKKIETESKWKGIREQFVRGKE